MAQHGHYEEGHTTVGREQRRLERQEQARREDAAAARQQLRGRRSI